MKKTMILLVLSVFLLTAAGCFQQEELPETIPAATAAMETELPATTLPPETIPTKPESLPTESTLPPLELTAEEQEMLLKIGMAELGNGDCTKCIALVMRTILNRVESGRFSSTIRGVLFAQDQFTPVADGTYYEAVPNERCYEALDMVLNHWDESQGAMYYEFCEGESWHSKNLHLLFQHCDTRFYD